MENEILLVRGTRYQVGFFAMIFLHVPKWLLVVLVHSLACLLACLLACSLACLLACSLACLLARTLPRLLYIIALVITLLCVRISLGMEGVRVRAGAGGGVAIQGVGMGSTGDFIPAR